MILKQIGSFFAKNPGSDVEKAAERPEKPPGRWTNRKLEHARRVDPQPNGFGPNGTWMNIPEGKKEDRSQTPTQQGSTVTVLRRQDTVTD
jgi:hypothetical protein